ncbi:MAG: hypothetical protein ACJA1R_002697, partial [Flavobacteriales bacterium]
RDLNERAQRFAHAFTQHPFNANERTATPRSISNI